MGRFDSTESAVVRCLGSAPIDTESESHKHTNTGGSKVSIEIITPDCIRIIQGFVSLQEISDWLITHRILGAGDILNEANETCGSWVHSNGSPSVLLEED